MVIIVKVRELISKECYPVTLKGDLWEDSIEVACNLRWIRFSAKSGTKWKFKAPCLFQNWKSHNKSQICKDLSYLSK